MVARRPRASMLVAACAATVISSLILVAGMSATATADTSSPDAESSVTAPASATPVPFDPAVPGDSAPAPGPGLLPSDPPPVPATDSDATTVTVPGYVDAYGTLFRTVQAQRGTVRAVAAQVAAAATMVTQRQFELVSAKARLDEAKVAAEQARVLVDVSARQIYMAGAGDIDGMVGVFSSGPERFLANADAWAYLSTATRDKVAIYTAAQAQVQTAQQGVDEATQALAVASATLAVLQQQYADAMAGVQSETAQLADLVEASRPEIQIGTDGCPITVLDGVIPEGLDVHALCVRAMEAAPTGQAAFAIQWALSRLGAPYACGGIGRLEPFRFDCSSFVSRAYYEGAGMSTASTSWAPSTRNMVPWDGISLDEHYVPIDNDQIRPGDLVLYNTCPSDGSSCPYRHVVMFLGRLTRGGPTYMAHTNRCGGVAHVEEFTGLSDPRLLGIRRVLPSERENQKKG